MLQRTLNSRILAVLDLSIQGSGSLGILPTFPVGNKVFKLDYPLQKRLGTRWTSGDIHIDRKKLISPQNNTVLAFESKRSTRNSAVAESHYPFWFGHLIIKGFDSGHHFFGDGAGDNHDVALPGGRPKNLGTKSRHVESCTAGGHHLDGATGYAEGKRPERISSADIDQSVGECELYYRRRNFFRSHLNTPLIHA